MQLSELSRAGGIGRVKKLHIGLFLAPQVQIGGNNYNRRQGACILQLRAELAANPGTFRLKRPTSVIRKNPSGG